MSPLDETLTILDFYGKRIKGKNDFLIKHKSFDVNTYVANNIKLGLDINEISFNCKEIVVQMHSYFSLNIIDLKSFNDEYNSFFNEKVTDNLILKNKISNFRQKNQKLYNQINWQNLNNIRNKVLAHNLRDKNNCNRLSLAQLKITNSMFNDLTYFTLICEIFQNFFKEFRETFENEIKIGYTNFESEYSKLKNS